MSTSKYGIGDKLECVDVNGQYRRLMIESIGRYDVVKQFANIEVLAQQYPSTIDSFDKDVTLFYICNSITGDNPKFSNLILWDNIIDHEKTKFITKKTVWRLDVLPIPLEAGTPVRGSDEIITQIKTLISNNIPDVTINYTDITDVTDNPLEQMKQAVSLAINAFDVVVPPLETVRPLIEKLAGIEVEKFTSNIESGLASIQARLATLEAGGSNSVPS
jgi:hypothetical protein